MVAERGVALACASSLLTCLPAAKNVGRDGQPSPARAVEFVASGPGTPEGFSFRLEEAEPVLDAGPALELAASTPLSPEDTQAVLARFGAPQVANGLRFLL